ncbi:MAG TPA: NAD(P)-binding domain-containing protein [Clostridiaceae bacterium]|nr:NAD(P)-binding domain-containing protein [Clostridiaceae bacterium]
MEPRKYPKVGVIGLGNMGGMLTRGFLKQNIFDAEQIFITDHNKSNTEPLAADYPGVNIVDDERTAATGADLLLISIKPPAIPEVILNVKEFLADGAVLWLTTSHLPDGQLERLWEGDAITFLPTLSGHLDRGVVLAHYYRHPTRIADNDYSKEFFGSCIEPLCKRLIWVPDDGFAVLNNITGCAPAFVAYLIRAFAEAVATETDACDAELLQSMVLEAFSSTCALLEVTKELPDQLLNRVGSPGGITFTALSALTETMPQSLSTLINRSVERHAVADQEVAAVIDTLLTEP